MRLSRVKVLKGVGIYHCMTRTVNGERLFGDREKEVLRKMLWQVADFSGVRVLTYCLMGNHFHVLVEVDADQRVSDRELLRRYAVLYPQPTESAPASRSVLARELAADAAGAAQLRAQLRGRMGDVSEFMKTLKQRFTLWFNRAHQRFGTLWSERFKSVLVERGGSALRTMAAYIDLNPVRAGLVTDPKDYRFCGYAEAVSGQLRSRAGLERIWGPRGSLPAHREWMYGTRAAEPGLSPAQRSQALRELEKGGQLPRSTLLRCRVRYFTDGAILGSAKFVERFVTNWSAEAGRKRPPKTYPMMGASCGDLCVIRRLRGPTVS